jgi:hypothetical protein
MEGTTMLMKSLAKIILAGVMAVASLSPIFAAGRSMHTPNACANPQLRCIADCDKEHWCRVYVCSLNQTTLMPLPCNQGAGLCWAQHC